MTITTGATTTATTDTADQHRLRSEVRAAHVPGTATQVRITARDHAFTIDEPAGLGGDDKGANPVEHLLAALGSCQAITFQVWAQKLGVALDSVDIELGGDIDLRGFFGLDESVRPGFQGIDVRVSISGPESRERYEQLIATVEKHCPVLDNLAHGVPVTTSARIA
ncbi:OsmC family protein [Tomitella fengzijianii]|uniref:OsmC family protein n=1 Tax=Tomitella fengzijianii TaxID=2597660 RepID=A0A516X1M7_9ACTN|nr:OsmC family protein [Tomitella fengzijianii]QDQ96927.1 OsmC family protein [Tomitella fengzijianii]